MDQQQNRQSEALFEQLNKNKKKKKRKTLRTVLIVILVIAVALVMVFNHLRQQVEGQFAAMAEEVQSYEVHRGPISTTVTGSGTLAEVGLETVTVPSDVEILEILVQAGDQVEEGDTIALLGSTGISTGPHLHFEVRCQGICLDPAGFLNTMNMTRDVKKEDEIEG